MSGVKQNLLEIEKQRLTFQDQLDKQKDQQDKQQRNKLGQFATPSQLANDIINHALTLIADNEIAFLDPAFGTGAFYSALLNNCPQEAIKNAVGIELDCDYGQAAINLWREYAIDIRLADFTKASPKQANLLICNPPYVRHHHLLKKDKQRLCAISEEIFGAKVSGLSGLYCHFIAVASRWMAKDGIAGWLIPSEFMDVNYGSALKHYLCHKVTLLAVHRYDPLDAQFNDALVSSAVVWIKNEPPKESHKVSFSFGGSLKRPNVVKLVSLELLKNEVKWTRFTAKRTQKSLSTRKISDYFKIRRGLATGNNDFFIVTPEKAKQLDIPSQFLKPILPSPKHLDKQIIERTTKGLPAIDNQLFLIDCRLKPDEVAKDFPSLWAYFEQGIALGVHEAYLCKNRSIWYYQDKREPAPIYCTYIGRKTKASDKPFSFVLNHSDAVVSNSYLALEPLPKYRALLASDSELRVKVWQALSAICGEHMIEQGRVYGGGLYKLEPKELGSVEVSEVFKFLD